MSLPSACDQLIDSQNCPLICLQQNYSDSVPGLPAKIELGQIHSETGGDRREQKGTRGYKKVQGVQGVKEGIGGTESTADTKIGFRRVFIGDRDEEHKDQYRQSVKL